MVEHVAASVATVGFATQAEPTNLGVAALMAAQVASVEPTTTQVLAVAVEQTSVPVLPVQSAEAAHVTQAEPANLGLAALMRAQVAASVPAATHALGFAIVDHEGLAVEMAAQVVSSEPAATHAVETVDHAGVAASLRTQLASSVAAVQQAVLSAGVAILHGAAAQRPLEPDVALEFAPQSAPVTTEV